VTYEYAELSSPYMFDIPPMILPLLESAYEKLQKGDLLLPGESLACLLSSNRDLVDIVPGLGAVTLRSKYPIAVRLDNGKVTVYAGRQ
jgi:hypothetical protein